MEDIKLDEVVNFYLDSWELPDGQYRRIHSLAVRAYRQIYMHATAEAQTVELEVLANRTSVIPCDCLNKISIGVMNGSGGISGLTEDTNIGFGNNGTASRIGQHTERLTVDSDSEVFYDQNGNFLTPYVFAQMGVGAQSDIGFYNIDWKSRLVTYSFNFPYTSVWLEYLPVFTDNGEYTVNPFFVEAILAFIGWQDKRRSVQDRNMSKQEYYNEIRIGKRSLKPFDPSQAFSAYARSARIARY